MAIYCPAHKSLSPEDSFRKRILSKLSCFQRIASVACKRGQAAKNSHSPWKVWLRRQALGADILTYRQSHLL